MKKSSSNLVLSRLDPSSPKNVTVKRRLSREEIINEMENEQDAIVVRLLREMEALKMENLQLRKQLNQKNQQLITAKKLVLKDESAIITDDEDETTLTSHNVNYTVKQQPRTPRGSFNSITSSRRESFNLRNVPPSMKSPNLPQFSLLVDQVDHVSHR